MQKEDAIVAKSGSTKIDTSDILFEHAPMETTDEEAFYKRLDDAFIKEETLLTTFRDLTRTHRALPGFTVVRSDTFCLFPASATSKDYEPIPLSGAIRTILGPNLILVRPPGKAHPGAASQCWCQLASKRRSCRRARLWIPWNKVEARMPQCFAVRQPSIPVRARRSDADVAPVKKPGSAKRKRLAREAEEADYVEEKDGGEIEIEEPKEPVAKKQRLYLVETSVTSEAEGPTPPLPKLDDCALTLTDVNTYLQRCMDGAQDILQAGLKRRMATIQGMGSAVEQQMQQRLAQSAQARADIDKHMEEHAQALFRLEFDWHAQSSMLMMQHEYFQDRLRTLRSLPQLSIAQVNDKKHVKDDDVLLCAQYEREEQVFQAAQATLMAQIEACKAEKEKLGGAEEEKTPELEEVQAEIRRIAALQQALPESLRALTAHCQVDLAKRVGMDPMQGVMEVEKQ